MIRQKIWSIRMHIINVWNRRNRLQEKEIISINGSVIKARGEGDFAMHDMVYVGENNLIGEVIKLDKDVAIVQVYEETAGLKIGEKVFFFF